MSRHPSPGLRRLAVVATLATVLLSPRLSAAVSKDALEIPAPSKVPDHMPDDGAAVWLAMRCAEGGEDARPALVAALDRMGWGVKDRDGNLLRAPSIAKPTGLAMRDYEIESLFWKPDLGPGLRLITYTRALAVAMPKADPEEFAQGLLNALRDGTESTDPQRRFWARFIVALSMAQDGIDLTGPGEPKLMPTDPAVLKGFMPKIPDNIPEIPEDASDAEKIQSGLAIAAQMMNQEGFNIAAMVEAATPKPFWEHDDPVLGKTPLPPTGSKGAEERMEALQEEMNALMDRITSPNPAVSGPAQRRYAQITGEMNNLNESIQTSAHRQMQRENDPDYDEEEPDEDGSSRFMAEHRSTPLSMLQIVLLTRVIVADLFALPATKTGTSEFQGSPRIVIASILPMPRWQLAQAAPGGPSTSFSGQMSSAGADVWATATGTYTGHILDVNLPDSDFADKAGKANAIMAWVKLIILLAQNEITLEVPNVPLVRTKNKDPGQQRRVKCVVEIDFPKTPDALKALRGLLNIATIDLDIPEGGPVPDAKVVWRLPEGSEATRYVTAGGGSAYRTDLAVVQFTKMPDGSPPNSAYVSYSDDKGEAFINIEGKPQKRVLPNNVRKKARRAVIAVEVTMKVGNLIQDLSDAAGTVGIKGSPGGLGILTVISQMIERSSLFFQKGKPFEVTDWVPPAWEGDIVITVKGGDSKTVKGEKGGPDVRYKWSMDRSMEAHLQTPEWNQEEAHERGETSNRIVLEVTEDKKRYRVHDQSNQTSRDVEAAFDANGPINIPPKSGGGPSWPTRAEPSGYAILTVWPETDPPQYSFTVEPTFTALVHVLNYERSGGRTHIDQGIRSYSLMGGVTPADLSEDKTYDPASGTITGSKTIPGKGNLPHVPEFDVTIEFAYTLKYVGPPPRNAP